MHYPATSLLKYPRNIKRAAIPSVHARLGRTQSAHLVSSIARHKNDPTAKYCQLATAAIGGGASCRTWVFRGFYEDKGALKFVTDRRSQKVPEIAADPGEQALLCRRGEGGVVLGCIGAVGNLP